MLTVIAEILTNSEHSLKTVIGSFKAIQTTVLQEVGCHGYDVYVDSTADAVINSSMQSKVPYSLVMYEQWETMQHLEAHMQTEHMQAHFEAVKDLVLGVNIRILEKGI